MKRENPDRNGDQADFLRRLVGDHDKGQDHESTRHQRYHDPREYPCNERRVMIQDWL